MNTKKLTAIALILILIFSLASCGGEPESQQEDIPGATEAPAITEPEEETPDPTENGEK